MLCAAQGGSSVGLQLHAWHQRIADTLQLQFHLRFIIRTTGGCMHHECTSWHLSLGLQKCRHASASCRGSATIPVRAALAVAAPSPSWEATPFAAEAAAEAAARARALMPRAFARLWFVALLPAGCSLCASWGSSLCKSSMQRCLHSAMQCSLASAQRTG